MLVHIWAVSGQIGAVVETSLSGFGANLKGLGAILGGLGANVGGLGANLGSIGANLGGVTANWDGLGGKLGRSKGRPGAPRLISGTQSEVFCSNP